MAMPANMSARPLSCPVVPARESVGPCCSCACTVPRLASPPKRQSRVRPPLAGAVRVSAQMCTGPLVRFWDASGVTLLGD
jgi:hypothetical protein